MNQGGRSFTKALPFDLGTNGSIYGALSEEMTALAGQRLKWCRLEIPWNYAKGGAPAFESTPGTYSSAAITFIVGNVALAASAGMKTLLLLSTNVNPGLSATWSSGIPCTPAQYGAAAGELVTMLAAQGLTGLHFELFNEPDGSAQGIPYALLVSAFEAAYPAMKAADSTCVVHFAPMEAFVNTAYFNSCSAAMPYCDIIDVHNYCFDSTFSTYVSPCGPNGYNTGTFANGLGLWYANTVAQGVAKPLWITEWGTPWAESSGCTPAKQVQWYQNLLEMLCGWDAVNGVLISSYLKAFFQFAASGAQWGIIGGGDDSSLVLSSGILTELVSGH